MFIGEAPGADEVEQGKPFVGKSGQILRSAIIDAGLDLNDVFITNVLCCRPLNNKFPDDMNYILSCKSWFFEQILLVKPKIIISIGGKAHKYIRESDIGITQACGKWENYTFEFLPFITGETEKYYHSASYMATLHPSFCMRGPDNRYPNPVMQLDSKGKINLFRENIASIVKQLKIIRGE